MRIVVDRANPTGVPSPVAASADGLLRTQDGVEDLRVSLRFSATRVSLWSGTTELGAWAVDDIRFVRRSTSTFEFVADEEHLLFMPDDPGTFSDFEIVVVPEPKPDKARPRRWTLVTSSASRTAPLPPSKENGAGPKHARPKNSWSPQLRVRLRSSPVEPSSEDSSQQPSRAADPDPIVDEWSRPKPIQDDDRLKDRSRKAWLYAIDQARKVDMLGLDRVPVTTKMRYDPQHEHTWDHRVASGFATRHVCTICGRVRLRSE